MVLECRPAHGWTAVYASQPVDTELQGSRSVAVDRKVYREPDFTLSAPPARVG